ncbi:MAG: tryptophan synthase subunit beta [Candidatus Thermoplasmatota archaeon]
MSEPDERGYFGAYGGRWVSETLVPAVRRVEEAFRAAQKDPAFAAELADLNTHYGGRPTPLTFARRLTEAAGGARLWLKREDLVHGGAHKFNNVMGQAILARRMGAKRIIAETGAGQHGVATAMAGAVLGIPVEVHMGAKDMARQAPNVQRMRLFGATIHPATKGSATLKDAVNEALRDWAAHPDDYYLLGSVVGPHPYPWMVRTFQSVIGAEARAQFQTRAGRPHPDAVVACVGGGSNAIGTFTAFLDDPVQLIGVEAAGHGLDTGHHAATAARGAPGILHGARSLLLQDDEGQVLEAHSVSAGLDYPGIGPELASLRDAGRLRFASATDIEALAACRTLAKAEGILAALESSHAVAEALRLAPQLGRSADVVVTISGRGDKDLATLAEASL